MTHDSPPAGRWHVLANQAAEAGLYRFSQFVVPALIACLTLAALVFWGQEYLSQGGMPVEFRLVEDRRASLGPAAAAATLPGAQPIRQYDTRLSEAPLWLAFSVPVRIGDAPALVEFPSRHIVDIACWERGSMVDLGYADRTSSAGRLERSRAGFALDPAGLGATAQVLCRVHAVGPARVTVQVWQAHELAAAGNKFHRNTGLVDGGLLLLAGFMIMTAIISREWIYVLFAAWLVANLRMAALSAGWDGQWLERTLPPDSIILIRKLSIAVFYVLTYTLFARLFADDLKRVGHAALLAVARWSCVAMLALALTLPFATLLPFVWVVTVVGIGILLFLLLRIVVVTRSKVAVWYAAALGITLFASFYEVIAAALGFKELIGAFNSVTAALSSSLIAALAIAEQLRQERDQRVEAQAALRNTYEAMPIGLFTLDGAGNLVRGNPALLDMLRIGAGQGGRPWKSYFEDGAWERLRAMVGEGGQRDIEIDGRAEAVGPDRRFLVKATLSRDRIEGSLQDVTEKSKAAERLRFLAENDPLTGVLNRRGVEKVLSEALERLAAGQPLALAYLDLDRFKLINDLYGHAAGDHVLVQVCERVRDLLSHGQGLGRVGGDEFVIVLPGTPIQSAAWTCRGVVERIGTQPYRIGDKAFQVRGSIGLVEVAPGMSATEAISAADRACRAAKGGNSDGLVVHEKSALALRQRESELRLLERLGSPAAHDGLFLEMQPIMSLKSPFESLNFEVLLRMREPDGQVVSAADIVSLAESNGRIGVIDRWVLARVLAWLDEHYDKLKHTQFVCVNLSGASLNDERFVHDAYKLLSQYVHSAGRLCIEITESVALHDLDNTRRFIDRVRGYGAKIGLDDFGAGYTSFSYLKELPADVLKIDGNFVVGVNQHPSNLAIVEAIVSLARNLGMKTIAEWVEDQPTLAALAEAGVDYAQGHAIAHPQAPERLLAAPSSASFVDDEALTQYLRGLRNSDRTLELWEQLDVIRPGGVH
jgi:diguanylate cyclase (GGDEF)-like protein